MTTERIRITTTGDVAGTQVLDADGRSLGHAIFDVEFRHRVGALPVLTVHQYLAESVLEGEMWVERVTICPSCKERQDTQRSQWTAGKASQAAADVTTLADTWRKFIAAPLDPEQIFYVTSPSGDVRECSAAELLDIAYYPLVTDGEWLISTAKPE